MGEIRRKEGGWVPKELPDPVPVARNAFRRAVWRPRVYCFRIWHFEKGPLGMDITGVGSSSTSPGNLPDQSWNRVSCIPTGRFFTIWATRVVCVCVYIYMIYFYMQLKLAHCKSSLLQYKNQTNNKNTRKGPHRHVKKQQKTSSLSLALFYK